ncbi:MAG: hypothetical protein ACD_62C00323G0006 [uncultured bacterium]|nr:MAG: hypothetical protein ACD_62C00323G0006 [uncultured bacterium]
MILNFLSQLPIFFLQLFLQTNEFIVMPGIHQGDRCRRQHGLQIGEILRGVRNKIRFVSHEHKTVNLFPELERQQQIQLVCDQ